MDLNLVDLLSWLFQPFNFFQLRLRKRRRGGINPWQNVWQPIYRNTCLGTSECKIWDKLKRNIYIYIDGSFIRGWECGIFEVNPRFQSEENQSVSNQIKTSVSCNDSHGSSLSWNCKNRWAQGESIQCKTGYCRGTWLWITNAACKTI